jgi:hypothetical protein
MVQHKISFQTEETASASIVNIGVKYIVNIPNHWLCYFL